MVAGAAGEMRVEAREYGLYLLFAGLSLRPVDQRRPDHPGVLPAAEIAEPLHREQLVDDRVLAQPGLHLVDHLARVCLGRAGGQQHHDGEVAAVLGGQEPPRQTHEQQPDGAQQRRFEQGGAQRRGKGKGEERGKRHGDRQRHRELPVDLPHRALEQRHREEHRGQHQGDGDDCAADLAHRLERRLARRQAFLGHDALDVLHHHDGVVHQDTDGQHHAEQGQHIDREAQHQHRAAGPGQGDGHHQAGDQGGAPAAQERQHDQEHQGHGFEQGVANLDDGQPDEVRGVERGAVMDARGELRGQLGHARLDRLGGLQRIGARRQFHRDRRRIAAVDERRIVVVVAAQFHPRHVGHAQRRTVGVDAQGDRAEGLRRIKVLADHQRSGERGARGRRQGADGTEGNALILHRDGIRQFAGGDAHGGEFFHIRPDAHGVFRAVHLRFADPGDPQ